MFGIAEQIRQIEDTLMRLPVAADKSCTVNRKDHRQVLNTDIVDHLIVSLSVKRRNTPPRPAS